MTERPSSLTDNGLALGVIALAAAGFVFATTGRSDPAAEEGAPPPAEEVTQAEAWGAERPRVRAPRPQVADDAEPSFAVEAPEVVALGWGWSRPRAESVPTVCVEFVAQPTPAQTSEIEISEVRDSYALSRALNVDASVSVKGVGYEVSGKASFAKTSKVSSQSVTYLVSAEVRNGATFAAPRPVSSGTAAVRLTPEAATLARQNLQRFQDTCGEGYVSATISGARAYLLASTATSSASEKTKVRASVQGSGWGVKVRAAAGMDSSSETSHLERTLTFYQEGGAAKPQPVPPALFAPRAQAPEEEEPLLGAAPAAPAAPAPDPATAAENADPADLPENAEQAIARIRKLATAAAEAGKVFELRVTPYEVLENFPRGADITAPEAEQDELAATWGAYATLYADLKDVLEHPANWVIPVRSCTGAACTVSFEPLVDDAGAQTAAHLLAEGLQDTALVALDRIENAARACVEAEEHCAFDASLVRSPYAVAAGMPLPRYTRPRTADGGLGEPVARTDITVAEHAITHLREPSMGRCVWGSLTPGCISNAEVRGWAARTGLASHVTARPGAVRDALVACGLPEAAALAGDADDADAPVVWYPLGTAFDADGMPVCAPADQAGAAPDAAGQATREG